MSLIGFNGLTSNKACDIIYRQLVAASRDRIHLGKQYKGAEYTFSVSMLSAH
jgi:hypothetical protein